MNITRATDYAIRLLVHLAANDGHGSCRQLAKEIKVPFNHLAKLIQVLSRNGFLVTRKGKGGGVRLAKDPSKIDLADIYQAIEGPICLNDCLFHKRNCSFSGKCQVRSYLGHVQSKIIKMLSRKSVLDLLPV